MNVPKYFVILLVFACLWCIVLGRKFLNSFDMFLIFFLFLSIFEMKLSLFILEKEGGPCTLQDSQQTGKCIRAGSCDFLRRLMEEQRSTLSRTELRSLWDKYATCGMRTVRSSKYHRKITEITEIT